MPRTDFQYAEACNDQMSKLDLLGMLTPKQKELIEDTSRILLIAGGSGTGKTIILKERVKRLAKEEPNAEVLVVNLPGGLLTEEFQLSFKDKDNIKVLDGKTCTIPEERQGIVNFLEKDGKGKHVLFDEVPLTLGIRDNMDEKSLSEDWAKILNIQGCLSLTFAFRPNDVTYTKDINIHDIKVAGFALNVLDVVKRNTQLVSDLFLALGDYSRRIFVCEEPTMRGMEFDHRGGRLLLTLLPIASCSILHASCENKLNCDAVRSSTAIFVIEGSAKKPLYVCVSNRERRDRLIHTLNLAFDIEVKFIDSLGRFRGKAESSIVVVTDDQILGYHPNSEIVILDLHECKWRNYVRMLSSCESEVTIVMDQETLQTGKYMPVRIGIPDLKTANSLVETNKKLKETFQENFKKVCEREQKITHLDEITFSRTSMLLFHHERKNEGRSNSDISRSTPKFTVIFGPPSSGKSMALFDSIQHLCQENQENDRILLLHMRSVLSHQASLDHLQKHKNSLDIVRSEAWSPHDILDNHQVHAIRWKYPNSIIHVHVDDYRIQSESTDEEIQMWRKFRSDLSKDQKLTLTIAFQSHSKAGREISMTDLTIFFRDQKVNVITLPEKNTRIIPYCTSNWLLSQIHKNETHTPLRLEVQSLPTGSRPGALVLVNVDDSWLLESMSRARTDLFIIDCLPSHTQVWQTMLDEERLEIYPVTGEEYIDDVTLRHLNSCGNFLVPIRLIREVSVGTIQEVEGILEVLHTVKVQANDLSKSKVCHHFSGIRTQLEIFRSLVDGFKKKFKERIVPILNAIRGCGSEEISLSQIVQQMISSPFNKEYLSNWLRGKEVEIRTLEKYLEFFDGVSFAFDPGEFCNVTKDLKITSTICFVFGVGSKTDAYLERISAYLKGEELDSSSLEREIPQFWFDDEDIMRALQADTSNFLSFFKANKSKSNLTFVVTEKQLQKTSHDIFLFESGVFRRFVPPGIPGSPKALEVTQDTIQLSWESPCYGLEFVEGYRVYYRPLMGEDEWFQHGVAEKTATVSGLIPNRKYVFKVSKHRALPSMHVKRYMAAEPRLCFPEITMKKSGAQDFYFRGLRSRMTYVIHARKYPILSRECGCGGNEDA
ncbi:unnamed protein product [Darwinula stevensoni]|uniref:Fibronectin type-III domain-containing protein n=1 Tax=Darwinula stevensoni TaxID=69355 RepID=A0A7R8ZX07_9CRUS|nr:unnamed protein product [Darwinula stevensoni]CAG0878536.1 unnamed protein product [Darwinula stevensoni]